MYPSRNWTHNFAQIKEAAIPCCSSAFLSQALQDAFTRTWVYFIGSVKSSCRLSVLPVLPGRHVPSNAVTGCSIGRHLPVISVEGQCGWCMQRVRKRHSMIGEIPSEPQKLKGQLNFKKSIFTLKCPLSSVVIQYDWKSTYAWRRFRFPRRIGRFEVGWLLLITNPFLFGTATDILPPKRKDCVQE